MTLGKDWGSTMCPWALTILPNLKLLIGLGIDALRFSFRSIVLFYFFVGRPPLLTLRFSLLIVGAFVFPKDEFVVRFGFGANI